MASYLLCPHIYGLLFVVSSLICFLISTSCVLISRVLQLLFPYIWCIAYSVSIVRRDIEHLHLAHIHYNGSITWAVPVTYHSACPLVMTYYPWDRQTCILEFSSWGYNMANLDILNDTEHGNTSAVIKNGEWIVESLTIKRITFGHPEPYAMITYEINIRRKPHFIFFNLLLPSIFITFCAYFVFLLPPQSGEKVSMSVTLLLSTTVFLLIVADYLPAQSDTTPIISK